MGTSAWLRKLQKDNPDEYRKVFKDFKENVPAETGGRSKKRTPWNPQSLVVSKSHEATKQSRWSGNFEDMRFGRFIEYFTKSAEPDERMTEPEARLAWMREPKNKTKVYSHKQQKHIEVECVTVEVSRTRHQEQIGSQKQVATQIIDQIKDATPQQVAKASARVMATLSTSFDDDMFAEIWLN